MELLLLPRWLVLRLHELTGQLHAVAVIHESSCVSSLQSLGSTFLKSHSNHKELRRVLGFQKANRSPGIQDMSLTSQDSTNSP